MRAESNLYNNNVIKRYDYLDILRVFAVFLVLFTHTGTIGNQIWSVTNNRLLLFISLPLDAYRCINTSLFLMISGALLLGRNESVKVLYRKRIFRMIAAIIIFSAFYYIISDNTGGGYNRNVLDFLIAIYKEYIIIPFWFLYFYVSFLIILPFLRAMAQNMSEEQYKYFIWCGLIYTTLYPLAIYYFSLPQIYYNISFWLSGYGIMYPMLGYYFHNHKIKQEEQNMWLGVGLIVICLSCFATYRVWLDSGKVYTEQYFIPAVMPTAVLTFISMKNFLDATHLNKNIHLFVRNMSGCAFGIFFLAPFLQEKLFFIYQILIKYMPSLLAIVINLLFVMLTATFITNILKRIPVVQKLF